MSEAREGDRRQSASARAGSRALSRLRRVARPRLLTATGLPAMLAVSGALPLMIGQSASRPAPSVVLCTGWARCNAVGYDSYGYGSHDGAMYWRMFPGDNCTNYVAYVESKVYHVATPHFLLGDGGQWAYTARAHGVLVNHTPSVGAVAEWNGGSFGIGGAGHVAVVEEVGPRDKYIVISQQNMSGDRDGYEWTKIRAGFPGNEWQEWPSDFIHFPIPRHADIAYYNARSRSFGLRYSLTAGPANAVIRAGKAGIIPLVGDWSGRGTDNVGYYNPKYGTFRLLGVRRTGRHRNVVFRFGPPHMIPLIGDWTGIGRDGVGYYDPKTATFNLRESLTTGPPTVRVKFGPPHMDPLAGDWNGGRRDGIGFYDPRTGIFRLRNTFRGGPLYRSFRFGPPHMMPLTGNWVSGLKDGIGYYNRWTGTFYLRTRLTNGPATYVIRFGPRRAVPRAGDWSGV